MQRWRPGDRIFCFGFSRGAFTARAVVGMVNLFGVLKPEHEPLMPTLVGSTSRSPPRPSRCMAARTWRRALGRWLHVGMARPGKPGSEATQPAEETTQVTPTSSPTRCARNFSRAGGDPLGRGLGHGRIGRPAAARLARQPVDGDLPRQAEHPSRAARARARRASLAVPAAPLRRAERLRPRRTHAEAALVPRRPLRRRRQLRGQPAGQRLSRCAPA